MAISSPASAFSKVDFPALGGPRMTNSSPSRSRSAAGARPKSGEHFIPQPGNPRQQGGLDLRRQILVREIDQRLLLRHGLAQCFAPGGAGGLQRIGALHRQAALRLGLGGDEIGHRLGFQQIHPAIGMRPAGEFARARHSAPPARSAPR